LPFSFPNYDCPENPSYALIAFLTGSPDENDIAVVVAEQSIARRFVIEDDGSYVGIHTAMICSLGRYAIVGATARVVDQDVDPAVSLHRFLHQGLAFRLDGDVHDEGADRRCFNAKQAFCWVATPTARAMKRESCA
jgi:hypothetical protein